jgi:hypothetical protein
LLQFAAFSASWSGRRSAITLLRQFCCQIVNAISPERELRSSHSAVTLRV